MEKESSAVQHGAAHMIASTFQALIVPSAALPAQTPAANALNDQGVQFWQRGRRSEAVASFSEASRVDSRFAVPSHNLGAIYLIEGQFTQAVGALQRAVRLAPGWALPQTHLAQAYLRSGNAMAALEASNMARALDPTLPDVRDELRMLLQARLQVSTAVARRRRNYFIFSLAVATVVTLLTAGIGFATLAVPIYRFIVFSQARRDRDAARRQLALLDAAPAPQPVASLPRTGELAPAGALPANGAYVVAGTMSAFSPAELADERAPSGTGYRRAGWVLLVLSVVALAAGVAGFALGNVGAQSPAQQELYQILVAGTVPFLVLAALCCMLAVLIGAVAAFRRHRIGWAIGILVVGGLGTFLIVPAQIMMLLYVVAMPHKPVVRGLELVPMPQATLQN
jgi:tetratricopeptide (TPR) repeat protein